MIPPLNMTRIRSKGEIKAERLEDHGMGPKKLPQRWDVLISGAGPSGSMTAYWLAKAGLKVLLLDRATFPRWKTCGGGLLAHAARLLPFDVSDAIETRLSGLCFSYHPRDTFTRYSTFPLIYGVYRSRFDALLTEHAIQAGASFADGFRLRDFTPEGAGVRVESDQGPLYGTILVGADGANSLISRRLNPRQAFRQHVGLACEIPREWVRDDWVNPRVAQLHAGSFTSGYGWIFPKGEMVNIGGGAAEPFAGHIRASLHDLVHAQQLLTSKGPGELPLVGHRLPTLTSRSKLVDGRVLLVGDAAGLVEPFTGDGITYAIHSARIAAEAITQALDAGPDNLTTYEIRVREDIAADFVHAAKLARWFHLCPGLLNTMLKRRDHLWEALCDVLGGTRTYASFRAQVLGPLHVLWPVIDALCLSIKPRIPARRAGRSRASLSSF